MGDPAASPKRPAQQSRPTAADSGVADVSAFAGHVIGGRYVLQQRVLGNGSFGVIVLASDNQGGADVAVKMERLDCKVPQLQHEARIIQHTQHHAGFPTLLYSGTEQSLRCHVMAIALLGPHLEDLLSYCARRLSPKTICLLMLQMLDRLQALHVSGYIHRDIKPENFLIGIGPSKSTVHIIDFGLSKLYRHPRTQEHVQARDDIKRDLVGTARYASRNAHQGKELSRRDDLESLSYVLIYLATGSLPWQGIRGGTSKEKYERIGALKMTLPMEDICRDAPVFLRQFLAYSLNLGFEEEPDYAMMRGMCRDYADRNHFHMDNMYDWTIFSNQSSLRVVVMSAQGLLAKGWGGASDVYVKMKLGDFQRHLTTIKSATTSPVWNEAFQFDVVSPSAVVVITVWCKRTLLRDKFLGTCQFSISSVKSDAQSAHEMTMELRPRGPKSRVAGHVTISLRLVPQAKS